jgi:hypothetical protein
MRILLPAATLLALSGCASAASSMLHGSGALGPGVGVTDQIAVAWCGDLGTYHARRDRMIAFQREHGRAAYVPQVGDTGCEVLARIGRPHEQT